MVLSTIHVPGHEVNIALALSEDFYVGISIFI